MLIRCKKEITKEQYERAWAERNGYITKADMEDIFTQSQLIGYGVYSPVASKEYNEVTGETTYCVHYHTGDSCD